jgi:predicted phosphodiesterase
MIQPLRIALVSDIHYGKPFQGKAGDQALELLDRFVGFAQETQPDLVIDLGDRINDQSPEEDLKLLEAVAERFHRLDIPRHHLLGNHDVANLSVLDNEQILGASLRNHSLDVAGWHLVFWYGNPKLRPQGFRFEGSELEWLRVDLEATQLPTVIFSHLPLVPSSMVGNWYFEERFARYATYQNWMEVRQVIAGSAKVKLAIAGHVHWNSLQIAEQVIYLTQQSLTETFITSPKASECWGSLDLYPEGFALEVVGNDWIRLGMPFQGKIGTHGARLETAVKV